MWEIVRCQWGEQETYLKDGYEPFAVAQEAEAGGMGVNRFMTYVYLRKVILKGSSGHLAYLEWKQREIKRQMGEVVAMGMPSSNISGSNSVQERMGVNEEKSGTHE